MEINTITLTVTPDELEFLGEGLESQIREEVKAHNRSKFDIFNRLLVEMLTTLTRAGYLVYIPGKENEPGRLTHNVEEFIDHLYEVKEKQK